MSKVVRLGIIGVGNMGSAHCRSILAGECPEIELVAVADRREDRRAWAREKLPAGTRIFDEGAELIASGLCDAVLIATPHYQHPTLSVEAMRHGLDVMCEKPVAVYTLAAREAVREAKDAQRTFALMFNQRTNCVYREIKRMLDSGELGALKRVNWIITDWYRPDIYYDSGTWRATWDGEGGGALLNQCPHQLDLLQWLCGMPSLVRAFCHNGKWHDIEVEDDVTAYLEFPGGATGVFVTSTGDLPGTNRLEITCDRGKLICEDDVIRLWRLPVGERAYCKTATDAFGKPPVREEIVPTDGRNPQHAGVLNAFAAHLLRGEPLVASGEEGLNGLTLSNAMHLSSWLGKPVAIPFDEALFQRLLEERRASGRRKTGPEMTFSTENSY